MIALLQGQVKKCLSEPARVIMMVNGVGYEVLLPAFVNSQLTAEGMAEGTQIELEIYYHTTERQPKPTLVGFRDAHQKAFFEQIIEVEGIGPARAVNALVRPPHEIAAAIEAKDVATLTQMPGVGRRAAEKMIASLHGKITAAAAPHTAAGTGAPAAHANAQSEAIQALTILKVNISEARRLVEEVVRVNPDIAQSTEEIIREVFKAQQAQDAGKARENA